MNEMFYGCNELKYADISSFKIEDTINLFSNLPDGCTIKINTISNNKINTIPGSCHIIIQDN